MRSLVGIRCDEDLFNFAGKRGRARNHTDHIWILARRADNSADLEPERLPKKHRNSSYMLFPGQYTSVRTILEGKPVQYHRLENPHSTSDVAVPDGREP